MTNTKDKLLFTPGPLTTSNTVKEAMIRDLGSRDFEFIKTVKEIREELLKLAGTEKGKYESIIMQGSGTFGVEAVISSVVPQNGKLLVAVNGEYGKRIAKIAETQGIKTVVAEFDENTPVDNNEISEIINKDKTIKTVAVVHCETTTGIMNDITSLGKLLDGKDVNYFVDAMSSFGAVPVDVEDAKIDFLVSSSNKCIEGVPGFSFIIAKAESLAKCKGNARSLSFDIYAQWDGLEKNGQFRFTPPVQSLLAFRQALRELEEEGGVEGRAARYKENYNTLLTGMHELGFVPYIEESLRGYIITSFLYPESKMFDFKEFYTALNNRGFVIYPGKLSKVETFRIGNIGRITKENILSLLEAVKTTVEETGIRNN